MASAGADGVDGSRAGPGGATPLTSALRLLDPSCCPRDCGGSAKTSAGADGREGGTFQAVLLDACVLQCDDRGRLRKEESEQDSFVRPKA
eukprot:6792038-Prymnesium_polylepis.2